MQKKSNLWLIVLGLIILLALLWPVFRREPAPADLTSGNDEMATTSDSLSLDDDTAVSSSGPISPAITTITKLVPAATPSRTGAPAPVRIPLKVFFGNQGSSPQTWQCGTVAPVVRSVANTKAVARSALTELLSGLRPADSAAGFFTALNPGVTIKQLTINNGVARVDFSQALISGISTSTTPCLKEAAHAQITETLKQFPTIRSAIISINGVLF